MANRNAEHNVEIEMMILGEDDLHYRIDRNGLQCLIDKADVVDVDYNTELDVVMTLPESVVERLGLG